jgi:hypothetical protein
VRGWSFNGERLIRVIDGCPPKRDWEKVKEMVGRGERFSTGKLLRTSWSHGSAEFALANSRLMAIEATTDGVRAGAARAGISSESGGEVVPRIGDLVPKIHTNNKKYILTISERLKFFFLACRLSLKFAPNIFATHFIFNMTKKKTKNSFFVNI